MRKRLFKEDMLPLLLPLEHKRAGLQKSQGSIISSLSTVLFNFPTRAVNQQADIQSEINSLATDRSCSSQLFYLLLPPAALSH